jgi:23S rRNA (cytosine1962-C5)-methyltransferase
MKNLNLIVRSWSDYELLDSGDNRKLERFGKSVLIRPETQALWRPARSAGEWARADAEFKFAEGGKGGWNLPNGSAKNAAPKSWEMQWNYKGVKVRFTVRLASFKHTGMFPEQAANWEWISERIVGAPKVLNLFGYTGIASIVAAQAGAHVTHVDASKQSNEWAKENARLSNDLAVASAENIRFLLDDALKFVEREVRRGTTYDGIILDPPAFGRGAKGEVWHIEEELPRLLGLLAKLLSRKPGAFFLLNGYAAGYSPQSFLQATASAFPEIQQSTQAEFGELQIQESGAGVGSIRVIPSGIYVRFVR